MSRLQDGHSELGLDMAVVAAGLHHALVCPYSPYITEQLCRFSGRDISQGLSQVQRRGAKQRLLVCWEKRKGNASGC